MSGLIVLIRLDWPQFPLIAIKVAMEMCLRTSMLLKLLSLIHHISLCHGCLLTVNLYKRTSRISSPTSAMHTRENKCPRLATHFH
ncbi:hypothetical protein Goari_026130 [Gossypium aridum]|uniref:Uncharacterized protein n=1 Tax=Gossypium aridum TaxID=34290 RepID=A0A7J8XB56_GOSAI|nr:hypothetical protein [Gossypium aridum]